MKTETATERTCPKCGCVYTEVPALSRTDNDTLICPDCGTHEALEALGTEHKLPRLAVWQFRDSSVKFSPLQ